MAENQVELKEPNIEDDSLSQISEATKDYTSYLKTIKWVMPRLLAIIFFIILFLWIYQAEGGIGSSENNLFGLHALLMAFFIVVFTQEALLTFSAPLLVTFTSNRKALMYFHISCHVVGICCAVGGLVGIVYYKSLSAHPIIYPFFTLYSPHSWMGVALLSLWVIQLTGGIFAQLFPNNPKVQGLVHMSHRYLGKVIYAVGLATCAMGLQDMQSSDLAGSTAPNIVAEIGEANMIGYLPNSTLAQYSCAGSLLLMFIGMATFATIQFVN
jgi:hypothetical protein